MPAILQNVDIQHLFQAQKNHQYAVARTSAKERIAKLNRLHDAVLRNWQAIRDAMFADYRKPPFEVDAVEIYPITGALKHTKSRLRQWLQPQPVPTPLAFFGSRSWVQYEPKGVCLIISPWNYPFNLSFVPLLMAVAAGNCVILKPSEFTPHSSALIKKILEEVFEENEVAVVEGDAETSQALLELPFNHIFFTGSPGVAKIVMAAAAKNLTPVTLELGGKSPTVIDETADLRKAAKRVAFTKFFNCGQTCVAPDYVLVQESKRQEFLDCLRTELEKFFLSSPDTSASYARIVNARNFDRMRQLLEEAVESGAKIVVGGKLDEQQNFVAPTVLTDVPGDTRLMQEEIFAPLLPVQTFKTLPEAIAFINSKHPPLTMNIFSRNRRNIRQLLQETSAGSTTINHSTLHFYNHDLPFGGVGMSGMGSSHGLFGFAEFCNARAVYRQVAPSAFDLLTPPYTRWKERLMELVIKWL